MEFIKNTFTSIKNKVSNAFSSKPSEPSAEQILNETTTGEPVVETQTTGGKKKRKQKSKKSKKTKPVQRKYKSRKHVKKH